MILLFVMEILIFYCGEENLRKTVSGGDVFEPGVGNLKLEDQIEDQKKELFV